MDEDKRKALIRKADFFLEEQTTVHINRFDGFWNGVFIKKKSDGVYLFADRLLGNMFFFVEDAKDIQAYYDKSVTDKIDALKKSGEEVQWK